MVGKVVEVFIIYQLAICLWISTASIKADDACIQYQVLNSPTRAVKFLSLFRYLWSCDSSMNTSFWYRFQLPAGNQMATSCVGRYRCGTMVPGWLNGQHPTVGEGVVKRQVCFSWKGNCCFLKSTIQIRNCGGFYLYKFYPMRNCYLRYCGNNGIGVDYCGSSPCPPQTHCVNQAHGYRCLCTKNNTSSNCESNSKVIRLVTESSKLPYEGRVEIYNNGEWGTVCDAEITLQDANVICRSSGYSGAMIGLVSLFRSGSGRVWFSGPKCLGSESVLDACRHGKWGRPECGHSRDMNIICLAPEADVAQTGTTSSSSVAVNSSSAYAVDYLYSSCFRSQKESTPWLQVELERLLFVHTIKVKIGEENEICADCGSFLNAIVQANMSSNTQISRSCGSSLAFGDLIQYTFRCQPPIYGNSIKLQLTTKSNILVVCHLLVHAFESARDGHGAYRQVWFQKFNNEKISTLKRNAIFQQPVADLYEMVYDFESLQINSAEHYGQRITAYLQGPEDGRYKFYTSCDDSCELWLYEMDETAIDHTGKRIQGVQRLDIDNLIVTQYGQFDWSYYRDYFKKPVQSSSNMTIAKCYLYILEAFHREVSGGDSLSVAMRLPSGKFVGPISGDFLYWTKPGQRVLNFEFYNASRHFVTVIGSSFQISGWYSYCCDGVYCPECSLELYLTTLSRTFLISQSLAMNCQRLNFTVTVKVNVIPGMYNIVIHHSFLNDSLGRRRSREVGRIDVKGDLLETTFCDGSLISIDLYDVIFQRHTTALTIDECNFESGLCGAWRTSHPGWKIGENNNPPRRFAYIDHAFNQTLQSPVLKKNPVFRFTGLCLQFLYLMRSETATHAHLKVYLNSPENSSLLFYLCGYHGNQWLRAQVPLPNSVMSKVIFEGHGQKNHSISVALDDIKLTSTNCIVLPKYARAGYSCSDDEFQCNNGHCVKKSHVCDGDYACLDQSDELHCQCLAQEFSCPGDGKCVAVNRLCDGKPDCKDGSDERNCGKCDGFQCVDGACIPWSSTCSDKESHCTDGSHFPSICGKCPLNDLWCGLQHNTTSECGPFRGYCGFQNGLCNLKHDSSSDFQWSVGVGQTPTKHTGPMFDHTTRSNKDTLIQAGTKLPY